MKVVYNKFIPFKGFLAITIFPFIFVRSELANKFDSRVLSHERIHASQQKEMLFIFFYIWYLLEYLIRLIIYRDSMQAYKNISFEREAKVNEVDPNYYKSRSLYRWIDYL